MTTSAQTEDRMPLEIRGARLRLVAITAELARLQIEDRPAAQAGVKVPVDISELLGGSEAKNKAETFVRGARTIVTTGKDD